MSLSADDDDPLLAAAQLLTQVRLATVTDGPSAVLRLLQQTANLGSNATAGWFAEQFTLATADAYLAVGEPRRSVTILAGVHHSADGDVSLRLAKAHRVAGDLRGAEAALDQTGSRSAVDALVTEVRRWLLLAQLHAERNDIQGARLLVERVERRGQRGAGGNGPGSRRLAAIVLARDSRLFLRHSSFLASLAETALRVTGRRRNQIWPTP